MRRWLLMIIALLVVLSASAQELKPALTVWLVPAEPPAQDDAVGVAIEQHAAAFSSGWKNQGVTILNLQGFLASRLEGRNVEFATSTWSLIKGQEKTLKALVRFASAAHVDLSVRFVSWEEAFQTLVDSSRDRPDVAQVGTTWTAYFVKKDGHPAVKAVPPRTDWRAVRGVPGVALPFITDIRVIFSWKRMPFEPATIPARPLSGAGWGDILREIGAGGRAYDHLAFPIVLSSNLLHNLASIGRSNGGSFLMPALGGHRVALYEDEALAPFALFAKEVHQASIRNRQSAVTFPELSYFELSQRFIEGEHRAVIDRVGFLKVWRERFLDQWAASSPKKNFWDYASIYAPPAPFRGGSELLVFRDRAIAFDLADFLAHDQDFTEALAQAGYLPSLHLERAIPGLFAGATPAAAEDLIVALRKSLLAERDQVAARTYPDLEDFPQIESTDVLEQLQRFWRRVAEGDEAHLTEVATESSEAINKRLNKFDRAWDLAKQNLMWIGPIATGVIVLVLLLLLRGMRLKLYATTAEVRSREEHFEAERTKHQAEAGKLRELATIGSWHSGLSGDLCHGFEELVSRLENTQEGTRVVKDVKNHAKFVREEFLGGWARLLKKLIEESETDTNSKGVANVINEALEMATLRFRAYKAVESTIRASPETFGDWLILRKPTYAFLCFEEWFYNTAKRAYGTSITPVIQIVVHEGGVETKSQGILKPSDVEGIEGKVPLDLQRRNKGFGLELIGHVSMSAFQAPPKVLDDGHTSGEIHVYFPLPLVTGKEKVQ